MLSHKILSKSLLKRVWFLILLAAAGAAFEATGSPKAPSLSGQEQVWSYRIVAEYPHDIRHFTQGLVFSDGKLFESTGLYGASAIYELDLKNAQIIRRSTLGDRYFGEGLTLSGERFFQLSWREQTGFIYDRSFNLVQRFQYSAEGWGITTINVPESAEEQLLVSDGTATLRILSAATLEQVGSILVRDDNGPVGLLNELESAREWIFANIWMTDRIVAIRPEDGRVIGSLDLRALKDRFERPPGWDPQAHVLNGIAYDAGSGHFFVTGKCWPTIFEIEVVNWQRDLERPRKH